MNPLTARQQAILDFIRQQVLELGAPPTLIEVAGHFGFSSHNAVRCHLKALASKGHIELRPNSARGIRLPTHSVSASSPSPAMLNRLPLIGSIAAGQPLLAAEHIDEWLDIAGEAFRPCADFLHRVSGHSMRDAHILDGDLVAIHAQSHADAGQIVAAIIPDHQQDDAITLKRYRRRGDKVMLMSENSDPGYEPIEIDLSKHQPDSQERPPFLIAGILVGLLRFRAA